MLVYTFCNILCGTPFVLSSKTFSTSAFSTPLYVMLSKPLFASKLLSLPYQVVTGPAQDLPNAFGYTDLGDAYVGIESLALEFNTWSFIVLTTLSMSLLLFWAVNPHPNFFFSLLVFELIFVSIAIETIGVSKILGISGGFVFALFLLTFAALESAVGLAYLVFFSKQLRVSAYI